jgi:hypothetical protein
MPVAPRLPGNPKQIQMTKEENPKRYDLEERTFAFARRVGAFVHGLKRTICNIADGRQLVKASGSVGANYIEANEALSKKDFRMRVRVSTPFVLVIVLSDFGFVSDFVLRISCFDPPSLRNADGQGY